MRLLRLGLGLVTIAVLFLATAAPVAAQSGRVQGTVLDESDAPLEGARVTTQSEGTPPKDTTTDSEGRFALIGFRSGRVTINVSLDGYGPESATVAVNQGSQAATANFTLVRARSNFEIMLGDAAFEGQDAQELENAFRAANASYDDADYDEAIAGYNQLLSNLPSFTALHMNIGNAHRAKGDFETALASYGQLSDDPEHAQQAEVEMARTRLAMGDLDAAADLVAGEADASREDLYNLGEVEFARGDVDTAAGWYEKAAAASPGWEKPWFKLALVALNKGDIDTAKQHFQKVVDLAPNSEEGAQAQATLSALP